MFFSFSSRAQIKDMQDAADEKAPEDEISGHFDVSGSKKTGNVESESYKGEFFIQFPSGDHLVFLQSNASISYQGEELVDKYNLEHLRYRLTVAHPFQWEAFIQHDANPFKRREFRALAGTGPRLEIGTKAFTGAIGLAYMREVERIKEAKEGVEKQESAYDRASSYLQLSSEIKKGISLSETTYYQPRIGHADDFRVSSVISARLQLSESLYTKVNWNYSKDSKPPEGVKESDSVTSMALGLLF